nr:annexin [Hymenolepis microstoma]
MIVKDAQCLMTVPPHLAEGQIYKPTILPTRGFCPNADAEQLKKAMRGWSTNEQTIIDILGRRTSAERLAIRQAYAAISKKSLLQALYNDLSGDFRDLAITLVKTPWEIMADAMYKAMKGAGTKERVLNEILASCSRDDIPEVKKAYEEAYPKHTLVKDIIGDTSGDYRDALLLVLEGQMDEPSPIQLKKLCPENLQTVINSEVAQFDAQQIYSNGEGRLGTPENRFMRPIINRSPWQLNQSNAAYVEAHGHSIYEAIKKETSGDFKNFLQSRVRYALDRPTFYAKLLHFAIAGPGTRDATLQRVLAMRADIDLESIKERYEELYKEPLSKAISEDTSKDYRKLCLKLRNSPVSLRNPTATMQHARALIHLFAPNGDKYKSTVDSTPGFSPTADAEHLKKAMKGLGTDEEAIINILGRRTTYERLAIRDAYPSISSKTLAKALKGDLSGKFEDFCLMLIKSPAEIMAEALYKAMKGLGTKERVLNEILGGISKSEVSELKQAYEDVSGGKSLEDAIKEDTSGHYQEALLLVLAGLSDEPETQQLKKLKSENVNELINVSLAEQDAKEIYDSGEGRLGTKESRFMRPLINRSVLQLNATNEAYIKNYGKPLVKAIKKETSRDFEDFLIFKVRYATDRAALFAELLHFCVKGPGTKDTTLQRTLALRADTDLGSIKDKYAELYGESLEDAIKGDTLGDYRQYARHLIHLFAPDGEKYKATISPTPGFSPTADAEHLKAAMRGLGTNEEAIINILGRRTTYERLAIRDAYPSISSKTLDGALKSELSGNFEEFCQLLIQSPAQIMAEALYKAMKGAGTKERVLNEIFGGISKGEINDLKQAFENGQ